MLTKTIVKAIFLKKTDEKHENRSHIFNTAHFNGVNPIKCDRNLSYSTEKQANALEGILTYVSLATALHLTLMLSCRSSNLISSIHCAIYFAYSERKKTKENA